MQDILKIIKALENSGILIKGITRTMKNKTTTQRGIYLRML